MTKGEQFSTIQREVKEWALANFGDNTSKTTPGVVLGPVASVLGIVEEMGEYVDAECRRDRMDALADILIYMCDWASRENLQLGPIYQDIVSKLDAPEEVRKLNVLSTSEAMEQRRSYEKSLVSSVTHLSHCTLKRHQGIRGMDDLNTYVTNRNMVIGGILNEIEMLARLEHHSGVDLLVQTWNNIVSKRDWVANKQTGS